MEHCGTVNIRLLFALFLDKKVEPKIKALKNFASLTLLNSPHGFTDMQNPTALKQRRLFNGFLQLFS